MANIQEAIQYSKNNPNTAFATELRKRIESGQFNNELKTAGLTQYIPASKENTQMPAEDPTKLNLVDRVKDIPSDIKDTYTGLKENRQKNQAKGLDAIAAMQMGDQGLLSTILQVGGAIAAGGAGAVGEVGKGALKLFTTPEEEKTVADVVAKFGQKVIENPNVQAAIKYYNGLSPEEQRNVDAAGGVASLVTTFVGVPAVGAASKFGYKVGASALESGINATRAAGGVVVDATKTAGGRLTSTILDTGSALRRTAKDIMEPSVSDATKVSLNPTEALKGTGQDITVSVKGKLKKLSELTPEDRQVVQAETVKNLTDFTKQAELFKKDRSVPDGSPVEIVGRRADVALELADKQRQVIGKEMGAIEQKYIDTALPVSDKVLKTFADTIKYFDNPKFGVTAADAPIVKKLVADYDQLNASGATISDRLEFVRAWDDYLRDSKDAFGNFKENKTVNTKIQSAVKELKNETVDHIAEIDPAYKVLRKQYAEHIQLQDIGDALLGKEGAYGERVKGAATVKRAIQSNSDAGARQFLGKLKEVTGYDAIKEGDIALTAMDNVGDYQGLSLLNILNDGQSGLVKKGLEKARDLVVGTDAERAAKYVKKGLKPTKK